MSNDNISQSVCEQQNKTNAAQTGVRQKGLHGSGPTPNWEHSIPPGHTRRGRGDLQHPQLTFWHVNFTKIISHALEAPDAGVLLHAQL